MRKTLLVIIALASVSSAADYSFVGATDAWAENAVNWEDADGNKLSSSGFLNKNLTSGNTFIFEAGKTAKAGGNTGGFEGAEVIVKSGGTLKIDEAGAVQSKATVSVEGLLIVNSGKALGPATVNVADGGTLTASGNVGAATVNVADGGTFTANGHLGAAIITLSAGAIFSTDGDMKMNGTVLNVAKSINVGNIWLDSNASTGSATFKLGNEGIVNFGTLAYRVDSTDNSKWNGTYTLSANCTNGYITGSGDIELFERTLMTFSGFTANSGDITTLLDNYIVGDAITLNGIEMTRVTAEFDAAALNDSNVGQYRFLIDGNNNLKVQYAAYTVPEPTTATLSLLALAGLAARRRRK